MFNSLVGSTFGRLRVKQKIIAKDKSGAWYVCECTCGKIIETSSNKLRRGHTKSCGCYREFSNRKHGHKSKGKTTPTYKSWESMRDRCNNPNKDNFKWYGEKGVTVCERWNNFTAFLEDMGERPVGTSLDRIDPHGNYEPSNCRWADRKTQASNKRATSSTKATSQS